MKVMRRNDIVSITEAYQALLAIITLPFIEVR
jgi:hypothetical protein